MKKTLFFTIDFPPMPGGMSRHSLDTALALGQAKEPVVVFAPRAEGRRRIDIDSGLSVVRLRGIREGEIFDNYLRSVMIYFARAVYYCLTHKVKAVMANTWSITGVAAFLIKKTFGVPYYVFAHGLDVCAPLTNPKVSRLMRLVLKNASSIIANSNFTAQAVRPVIRGQNTIKILHPVVDIKRVVPSAHSLDKRIEGKKVILTVARLVESKNHEAVLRAFARVVKVVPNAMYRIIGQGPLESRLKELVNTLGLADKVVFAGEVKESELSAYYYSCDVFVMASREIKERGEVEGFGIVFLEAGACARPVIAAKSGGIPDAVIDGVTGLLIDPLNEEEIAQAIIRILQDEALAKSLGENGRRRAENDFTLENLGEKLKGIINS